MDFKDSKDSKDFKDCNCKDCKDYTDFKDSMILRKWHFDEKFPTPITTIYRSLGMRAEESSRSNFDIKWGYIIEAIILQQQICEITLNQGRLLN